MSELNESLRFNNKVRATLRDAQTNEIISVTESPNTVVNVGRHMLLDSLGGTTDRYIKHGAVGTASGGTSAGSILLQTEMTRVANVYTRAGLTGTFSMFFNWTQANSGEIREIAFFGGTSSYTSVNTGVMFNRILLVSGINKTSNFTLTIDLDVLCS